MFALLAIGLFVAGARWKGHTTAPSSLTLLVPRYNSEKAALTRRYNARPGGSPPNGTSGEAPLQARVVN